MRRLHFVHFFVLERANRPFPLGFGAVNPALLQLRWMLDCISRMPVPALQALLGFAAPDAVLPFGNIAHSTLGRGSQGEPER